MNADAAKVVLTGMSKNPRRRRSWWQRRSTWSERGGESRPDVGIEPALDRVIELAPAQQPAPENRPRSDVVTAAGLHCVIGVLRSLVC